MSKSVGLTRPAARVGGWVGLGLCGLALAAGRAAAAGITLEPAVNLSSSSTPSGVSEVSPQGLAVDPDGRVIAVWNEFKDADSPPELMLRVSGPDGRFGRAVALTPADGKYSGEGALAVTPDGKVSIAWTQQQEQFAIWFARLDLAVGTLVSPAAIPGSEGQLTMEPAIAAGPKGEIAIAWTAMEGLRVEVKACRLTPAGAMGAVEEVSAVDGRASDQPSLAYGPDGRLYLVWSDSSPGVRRTFYAVHDGKQWSTPAPVEAATDRVKQSRPVVAVSPRGEVLVAWHDGRQGGVDQVFVARAEAGKGFGKAIAATQGVGTARSPALAAGPNGAYLAWEDGRVLNLAEPPSEQIYLGPLAAAAGPVREEKAITTDRPVSTGHPSLVVDRTGALHLMWWNSELGAGDVFYAKAMPGS